MKNKKYERILEQRTLADGQSRRYVQQGEGRYRSILIPRPIVRMEDTGISRGKQNQLASGYANSTSRLGRGMVVSLVLRHLPTAPSVAHLQALHKKQQGDKKARLEQTELTDRLFDCFNSKPYWSFVVLSKTLEQPDQWLREVLTEVAEQVPSGPYAGLWALKPEWSDIKDDILGEKKEGAKDENEEEEESDDDDDEDMEEVGM